jgi:hypothetical protein
MAYDFGKTKTNQNKKTLQMLRSLEEKGFYGPENTPSPEKLNFFRERPWHIKAQENLIFTHQQLEVKKRVEEIMVILEDLTKPIANLAKEVETAVATPPVIPGIYHVSFFQKLKETLILLKQNVELSATWLATANHRGKKKGHYWDGFEQSGQKYLGAADRQVATQVG